MRKGTRRPPLRVVHRIRVPANSKQRSEFGQVSSAWRVFDFVLVLCFETVASWQQCIHYNTTSARLSKLGATPAAHVSGGQFPPSTKLGEQASPKQGRNSLRFPTLAAQNAVRSLVQPPSDHQETYSLVTLKRRASPGKKDPTNGDSSAHSLHRWYLHASSLIVT